MKKRLTDFSLLDKQGSSRFSIGKFLLLLMRLGLAFGLQACAFFSLPTTIKYRLTLEVEANGAVHTGSGVIETRWYNQSSLKGLANGIPWFVHTRGEAVTIDLGSKGLLFVLLTGVETKSRGSKQTYFPDDPQQVLLMQFSPLGQGSITPDFLEKLSHRRDVVKIPASGLPMLVHFRDIHDPATVEQVHPDDLATSFGPEIKLRGATIAITDEPLTIGIEEKLGWLKSLNGGYLTGKHISSTGLAGTLYTGMFERK